MTISAEKVLEDACQMYRELCQKWLPNREAEWPEICREKCEVDLAKRIVVLRSCEGRYLRRFHYQRKYSMWEPEICRECQEPILDCYMVKDELWKQAGYGPLDLACIQCLEKQVGRPLLLQDFTRRVCYQPKPAWWVAGWRVVTGFFRTAVRYAWDQVLCAERVVAWSNASRFHLGRKLAGPYAGRKLLDYGCGDGTFLAFVQDLFPEAVGADIDPKQTADCAKRFAESTGLRVVLTDQLRDARHDGAYGLVVCLEVLEHCLEETWDVILSDLARLAAPDGTIVISIPIEIGPSLLGKQLVRTVAGRRGLDDYKDRETYTVVQFWKMVLAGERTTIARPVYRAELAPGRWHLSHGRKGFNWRKLRARVNEKLAVDRTCFSPLSWSGGYFSSQAWFLCKRR